MKLSNWMVDLRDLYHIAWGYCRQLQTDLVASIGDSAGIGQLQPGQCFGTVKGDVDATKMYDEFSAFEEGDWAFPPALISGSPPAVNAPGGDNASFVVGPRSLGLVRLDTAATMLRVACVAVQKKISGKLRARAQDMLGKRIKGAFRFELMSLRASARGNVYLTQAVDKLTQATMHAKRHKRTGLQRISTRNTQLKHGPIRFGYNWAYRAWPGRQALTRKEWKKRYLKRLHALRKTKRHSYVSFVKVPETKHPRPRFAVKLAGKHGTVKPPQDRWDGKEAFKDIMQDIFEDVMHDVLDDALTHVHL